MAMRKTTDEFRIGATEIHGYKYDYSEVEYINSNTKVKIICKACGTCFLQKPNDHLLGKGCRICHFKKLAKSRTLSIEDFIDRARSVHGDRYDYSKSKYITALTKIEIICSEHGSFWQVPASHFDGHGCHRCKVENQTLDTNDFLKMAYEIHGDTYCYDKTIYKYNKEDVIITCRMHGDFEQSPRSHLVSNGCPKCAINAQKVGRDDFVEISNKIHNYKYNYDDVIYETNKIPVIIHCPEHGEFKQAPSAHMSGAGCIECSRLAQKDKVTFTTEKFKEFASIKHNNFFNYDKVDYKHSHIKIIITCPNHGDFEQDPGAHLAGTGCQKCANDRNKSTTEEFIEKASKIHNNEYDYSKVIYEYNDQKIIIICKKHGEFLQSPNSHLVGQRCPKCATIISKPCTDWLNSLGLPDDPNHREVRLKIAGRTFRADGFDLTTNTVYEFNGDFWHGNPNIYDANKNSGIGGKTFGEIYNKTIEKENVIKNAGYRLITIWESDWNSQQKELKRCLTSS